jgi:hypothetical protein
MGARIASRLAELARALTTPRCGPCHRPMRLAREILLRGTETTFEVIYVCDRCGACERRLRAYEPVH